jgi:hypothetical protein
MSDYYSDLDQILLKVAEGRTLTTEEYWTYEAWLAEQPVYVGRHRVAA